MLNLKITFLILLILAAFAVVKAQDDEPIKINTYLLNIPVIASDRDGRNVAGLTKENFTVMQDGEKQNIEFFADSEAPMNVAILIDISGSTIPFINDIKNAAWNFVKVFRSDDKGLIVTFDSEMYVLTPLTSDKQLLKKAILNSRSVLPGASNMQDALYQIVTKEFASVKGRKAVIVLTDGQVIGHLISNGRLLDMLAEADSMIYPVIFNPRKFYFRLNANRKWKLPSGEIIDEKEFRRRVEIARIEELKFMNAIAAVSGGRLFDSNDFEESFQAIADELKKQYLIGFYPQNVDDGKPHQITVEVKPENIVIRTKRRIRLKIPEAENK